jgi:hypothetical protein
MSSKFNLIILSILFLSICATGFSQNHPDIRTRDVIYLKDGRVLKGEIVSIDEADGKITFAGKNGKTIEIKRVEYEYYIEDERLNVKFSDTLVINTRKTNEFEFSFGLSTSVFEMNGTVDPNYNVSLGSSPWYIPYNIRVAAGRYFGRQHYIGLRLDYALGGLDEYISPALKYKFQFDGYRNNRTWYATLEGKYEYAKDEFMSLEEYISPDGEIAYAHPYRQQVFNTFGVVIGPGYAYTFKNRKSFCVEATIFKNYALSNSFVDSPDGILINSWNSTGIGLALAFNM